MIKTVTKKAIIELATIIKNKGYWNNEVKEFLEKYEYSAMQKLNDKAKFLAKNGGF